jgi:hypothetical protein
MRLDSQAVVDRAAKAEADRTVTIRPAPDCMTYVTALLPVAQGVGVYAARNRGGPTSATNGLGECERCNYAKEAPGWRVTTADENGTHIAEFVTPTGARCRSTAPPLPGAPLIAVSEVEVRIGVALADLHAA